MKFRLLVFSIASAFFVIHALTAHAQFYPIDELVGPAPEYGGGVTVSFDLGQEFEEVREVLLLLEATTTPLTALSCGTISEPEPCQERRIPIGFHARIDDPGAGFLSAVVDGFRSDRPVRNVGAFNQVFLDFDFDSLKDGKGQLTLFWNQVIFSSGTNVLRNSIPSGEILDAVLVIDGTPVSSRDERRSQRNFRWKNFQEKRPPNNKIF